MRAFHGQLSSDAASTQRARSQKQARLSQLKQQLAALAHTVPAGMRESLTLRIAELERSLAPPPNQAHRR